MRFAIERHLHDYLFDQWDHLELAANGWVVYERDGEPDAGYEFFTPIGRIDLLARHRETGNWLVLELKRGKSSDVVVGQVLRCIGWVKEHLAGSTEEVEGLIIATEADLQLRYALKAAPLVAFKMYEVEFRLTDGPS